MKKVIAFISEHASPLAVLGGVDSGGQNVYVAELCRELAISGYRVDVYTRRDSTALPAVVHWQPDVRVIHIDAGPAAALPKEEMLCYMNEFAQNMLAFINVKKITYSLIHANFFMSGLVASRVKHALNIPYVITFHALGLVRLAHQKEADKFPPERIDIEKFLVQDADKIIAECPQDADDLIHYYDAPRDKISIIPCGFSTQEFYPVNREKARKYTGISKTDYVILQLGRMVPRKGVDNVIKAAGRLHNTISNLHLVIVGGEAEMPAALQTPEIKRLQQIGLEEKILTRISFAGRKNREELKYYYSAADVFITTPWYEPFGITPLEAMACGTPVIGAEVGGIKYSILHGQTGFLVPPNDPAALAAKIEHLHNNNSLAAAMGKNALQRVNKLFTWRCVASTVKDLYEVTLVQKTTHKKQGKLVLLHDLLKQTENKLLLPQQGKFNLGNA